MIFIGLGSSIGNAEEIFASTEKFLNSKGIKVLKKSEILKNPPIGEVAKNEFSNAVWQINFEGSPFELLEILQTCENVHGRERKKRWDDRTLDLDILMFDDQILNKENLIIPHPEIQNRFFVLEPWTEIVDEDFEIPTLERLSDLLSKLK